MLAVGAVMFAMFAGIAAWTTHRQAEEVPTPERLEQAEAFGLRGRVLFAAGVLDMMIGAAGGAIGGVVGLALILLGLVLGAVAAWHAIRYLRAAQRLARR